MGERILMPTEGRVEGVFAKADPWIQYDTDIERAGPMAEFLHIRAILYARRNLRDGTVPKQALGEIGDGIPAAKRHADLLVLNGLWIDEKNQWRIRNWAKWNLTGEQRKSHSRERSSSGKLGMHSRWHSPDRPVPKCQYCQEKGWIIIDI
jgi:hypothetical protein